MKPILPGNDPFLGQMERALDVMTRRQGLLASNVGNIDTPRYKTVDIDFKSALQQAVNIEDDPLELRRSQPGHPGAESSERLDSLIERVRGLSVRNDGNNVALDREMLAVSETAGRYETTAAILRSKLRQLMYAVSDGRSG